MISAFFKKRKTEGKKGEEEYVKRIISINSSMFTS